MSNMGRPRLHDEATRTALLAAAERLVVHGGADAVTVRGAASGAGTTTRAVYALFGSKEGLDQALAQRTYELLMERVAAVPLTSDPGHDLIACAVKGFRGFALEHPDLFRLFFTAEKHRPRPSAQSNATRLAALSQLIHLVERAQVAGLVGDHPVEEVALLWDALCTGLAMRELCGPIEHAQGERIWTDALGALLIGLGSANGRRSKAAPDPPKLGSSAYRRRADRPGPTQST